MCMETIRLIRDGESREGGEEGGPKGGRGGRHE